LRAGYAVAHVVGGLVDVSGERELDVDSSAEVDLMTRMPSIEAISFSSGSVTFVSTTSADAPGYDVSTETVGESMFGYSRTGRR
jgi:hypothetical protein